jgi:hypothetical protein
LILAVKGEDKIEIKATYGGIRGDTLGVRRNLSIAHL